MNPKAGWYPAPDGSGHRAYWLGDRWAAAGEPIPKKQMSRGVRIGLGVVAGLALAHVINSAGSSANGWGLASWANQNGVQL